MGKYTSFSSEEEFEKIMNDCFESQPSADESVLKSFNVMDNALNDYIYAIEKNMFRYAYQCGYRAGVEGYAKA